MNKKMLKKLLVSLLIVLLVSNVFVNNIVLADTAETGFFDVLGDFLGVAFGSVVGLLTYPFRLLALALSNALDGLTSGIAYSQGTVNEYGVIDPYGSASSITPFDIFFNKLALLDVNFFNIPAGESIVRNMRLAIAGWYYVMRNIAASILLCVLIYVGIRMAISTVASDKAAFKKMLVDWVCSLALIFLIQYIIIFTFAVNEALIGALRSVGDEHATAIINAMEAIKKVAKNLVTLDSIPATIVYCMLVGQTLALVFSYFNRMLKIAFLVIISPLITLTYSIDKMGDGKAQALGTWLKEFVYTVLLQVFHCIIYMVFVGMAVSILNAGVFESYNLVGSFLAVMCVKFTKDAEKLLGKIFKFGDSTSDASIAVGMALSAAAFQKAGSIGKGAVKGVNSARSLVNHMGDAGHKTKVAFATIAARSAARKNGEKLTMEQAREAAEARVTEKEAAKAEKKNKKKYNVKADDPEYTEKVNKEAERLQKENPQMSEKMAAARARANIAANARSSEKEKRKPRIIKKASGAIREGKAILKDVRSTEIYKEIANATKAYMATGAALFAGSAMYGVQGDAFKAFATGGAMFKGTSEVLKNSSTTLVDDANNILDGLDAKSQDDVAREMQKTHEMAPILSDNNELQKHLDTLLQFVDQQLARSGFTGDEAKNIKSSVINTVKQAVKKDPTISDADLLAKIKDDVNARHGSETAKAFAGIENAEGYTNAVHEVGNTQRRKELYDVMEKANALNLTPETFTNMVQKRYAAGVETDFRSNDRLINDVLEESGPIAQGEIDAKKGDEREELRKGLEDKYEEFQGLGASDTIERDLAESIARTYDADIADLRKERSSRIEQAEKDYQAALEQAERKAETDLEAIKKDVARMARDEAQVELNKAKARIEAEAQRAVERAIENRTAEIQTIKADISSRIKDARQAKREWHGKANPPEDDYYYV